MEGLKWERRAVPLVATINSYAPPVIPSASEGPHLHSSITHKLTCVVNDGLVRSLAVCAARNDSNNCSRIPSETHFKKKL